MVQERDAGHHLVGEGEREGQVGVEVDDPPVLVGLALTHDAVRRDSDHHEEREGDHRGEDVGVVHDEDAKLLQRPDAVNLGVAQGYENDVQGDQDDRPAANATVPADQLVLADRTLEPRDARDEKDHHQHQVRAQEARQPSGSDEPSAR